MPEITLYKVQMTTFIPVLRASRAQMTTSKAVLSEYWHKSGDLGPVKHQ